MNYTNSKQEKCQEENEDPWNSFNYGTCWSESDNDNRFGHSPVSSCSSPEFVKGKETKRGRPRADAITHLIVEGATSPSAIKCTYCNRVFPREKSLQAHVRTHTGI